MNEDNRKLNKQDTTLDDKEFNSFFDEVLHRFPAKTSKIIQKSYNQSREIAEKLLVKNQSNVEQVFENFLSRVDREKKQKSHRIIHAASLSAAIVGCSPIPFSDALLLVPIQLTMMSRLHKLFGQPWLESLGKSLSKELVVVSFGRSAVGNILKFIPAIGTVSGAVINAAVAVSITEALGWVTVKMLNDGEDIFEQAMSFRGQFAILFKTLRKAKDN
ncbi:GTPase [Leuconostoc litchii]|uniref:DUF697 domain-containing protein n=1 Tax=Leuconostoc litchii TaxID=1981069 RepID=A0A6P2CMJ7_9LACO|nr:YcjF family protein [Leuconostoc litchii]TYC47106.1 DUF697 domain-containing protein [Leuconostoc litchii]GMA69054.1 GTPase [Leuconostoc litchii]